MKEAPAEPCSARPEEPKGGPCMLYRRIGSPAASVSTLHLLDQAGSARVGAAPPDGRRLRTLAARSAALACRSSRDRVDDGARFVPDQLELLGWESRSPTRSRSGGLAPWPARPTASTPGCWRSFTPRAGAAIWLPTRPCARARADALSLHLVRHRTSLKQRVHAILLAHANRAPSRLIPGLRPGAAARLSCPSPGPQRRSSCT